MTDTPTPAGTPEGGDPSMEDILASIRRILNEEETPTESEPASEPLAEDDVLVLDQTMLIEADTVAAEPEVEVHDPDPEPDSDVYAPEVPTSRAEPPRLEEAVVMAPAPVEMLVLPAPTSDLVAPETAAAAASSVSNLMRTLAAGRSTQVYSGGPTLEDIVRAELRPLLKEWLDSNLPPLVERLVRTEIERVVGRAVP